MDVTLTPAFAVPIFSAQLDEFSAHRAGLIVAVLAEQAKDPGLSLSNRYGWHSRGDFYDSDHRDVAWLMAQLGRFTRGALGSYDPIFRTAELVITSCWANAGGPGAWNAPHNHMPSHWSGVVYVDAEDCREGADDLGGLIEFLNPHPMGAHHGQPLTSTFVPKDGMVLLFPAYLLHYVHPNRQAKVRISLSFNLDVSLV